MYNKVLITGSAGLIGSEAARFFLNKKYDVYGIDNDMRSYFFGKDASTKGTLKKLKENFNYHHYDCDIRNYEELKKIFKENKFDIIVHTAAQPSHDWAAKEPLTDFEINAIGTFNILELMRLYCENATMVFTSTNKCYGDNPNYLSGLVEEGGRFEVYKNGVPYAIDESMSIDQTKHSIFGSSKVAADIMTQEYGKYFGMKIGVFRGGCLTGENHAGAELHGFLSYLVKCIVHNKHYNIFGYKGKQVRDNIYSKDLINMFWRFIQNPRCGEVYNAGGGRENSTSILEAIETINEINGSNWNNYDILDNNRIGDHIWYITDLSKFKKDYPGWVIETSLIYLLEKMVAKERSKCGLY